MASPLKPVPIDPPLLVLKGLPLLHPVLGVVLHLEPLGPGDGPALEAANEQVLEWIGHELGWTTSTLLPLIEPLRRADLDYVPGYAYAQSPPALPSDPAQREWASALWAATYGDFTLLVNGGETPGAASPYSYRFASVIRLERPSLDLHTCAMLRVTVPRAWPLADFHERSCRLASALPVRWGGAGFMYSAWETAAFEETFEAIYAHARRHHGYDMGHYAAYLEEWHDAARTVNWLTFVGDAFATRIEDVGGGLASRGGVTASRLATCWALRAGDQPEEGDINRLRVPRAYVEADAMIRPVRAAGGIDFKDPWSGRTSEDWLRRFEKKVS